MKLVPSILLSLSLVTVSALGAVACGGTVEHTAQTASGVTKAPIGTNTHGVVKMVGDALGEVPLRPEQRTEIEKLAQDAETRHAPLANGRKELMLAFADQVEAGKVDKTALQPKIDRMTGELDKARIDDRAALGKLHGILDPDQRNAFVDALEGQLKAKHGGGEHHVKGFAKLKQLADDLKLTEDQRSKIHDVIRESFKDGMKEHHARHGGEGSPKGESETNVAPAEHASAHRHHMGHGGKKALEAFREDKLDLDKVAPPHDIKAIAPKMVDHVSATAEKILPILTPEQRKIAADKIRAMALSGEAGIFGH